MKNALIKRDSLRAIINLVSIHGTIIISVLNLMVGN